MTRTLATLFTRRCTALPAISLLGIVCVAGCQDTNRSPHSQTVGSNAARTEMNDQNLVYAFSVLRNTDEFQTANALATVVGRLSQWSQSQKPIADWAPDPLLETLPEELRKLPAVQKLGDLNFPTSDGAALQQNVWLNEIGQRAHGPDSQALSSAQALFDWIVRNIQIERDGAIEVPHTAREILVLGRGSAAERAWLFALLGRQQRLDIVALALPGSDAAEAPKPWLTALALDGELYLFDPRLGLPVPGPEGRPVATLKEVLADESLLHQLDLDAEHPYPVQTANLAKVIVLVEGSPEYLSQRMRLVELKLPGKETLVLTAQPQLLAERVKGHPHVDSVRLWPLPYERLRATAKFDRETRQKSRAEWASFQQPTPVLWQARILHLLGSFDGDKGASAMYQAARPADADLQMYLEKAPPNAKDRVAAEIALIQSAKQSASYWLGLIALERGNYPAAVDYLQTRTLAASPNGPFTAGARFNLGRAFEALGKKDEAIKVYNEDRSPQRHGDLLRARRLEQENVAASPPAAD